MSHQSLKSPGSSCCCRAAAQPSSPFWLGRITTWTNTLNWISLLDAVFLQCPRRDRSRTPLIREEADKSLLTRPNKSTTWTADLCHFPQPRLETDKRFHYFLSFKCEVLQGHVIVEDKKSLWGYLIAIHERKCCVDKRPSFLFFFSSWYSMHLKSLLDQVALEWAVLNVLLLFVNVISMDQINGRYGSASIYDTYKRFCIYSLVEFMPQDSERSF